MKPIEQNAIVLGGVNYSDSSRVVWTLTPDYGRQSFLVKGARRAKSKFLGSLETFSLIRIIYNKGEGKSLFSMREVDVKNQFYGIRKSLDSFWAASRAVELVKAVSSEEHESRDIFILLNCFLDLVNNYWVNQFSLHLLLMAYYWRLVSIMGHEPQLTKCVKCSSQLSRIPRYRFLLDRGGVICDQCNVDSDYMGNKYSAANFISYNCLSFIYKSSKRFPAAPDDLPNLKKSELGELESLSDRYLAYHLGEEIMTASRLQNNL